MKCKMKLTRFSLKCIQFNFLSKSLPTVQCLLNYILYLKFVANLHQSKHFISMIELNRHIHRWTLDEWTRWIEDEYWVGLITIDERGLKCVIKALVESAAIRWNHQISMSFHTKTQAICFSASWKSQTMIE